ncbi:MAG: response regulator [Mollicutes bacterium]|nr:response regulator [Mollicutes bacterium]
MVNIYNIYIPLCSLLLNIFLIILYLIKTSKLKKENNYYFRMIVDTFFMTVFCIVAVYLLYVGKDNPELVKIIKLSNKLECFFIVNFFSNLLMYTIYSCKLQKRYTFKLYVIFNLLALITLLIAPVGLNVTNDLNYMVTVGLGVDITTILSGIIVIMTLIIAIRFRKLLEGRVIPIVLLLIFIVLIIFVRSIIPEVILLEFLATFATMIMYHTIENPDLKMIESLNIAKSEAERANMAKSDFLASMSHELRTPLNAITGFSHAILSYDNLPIEVVDYANDIVKSSDTLLEIVGGVLDVSKIESNKMEIVEVLYKPKEEFENLAKLAKSRIGEKPIIFNYKIAEDVPYQLYGDRANIKKIVTNLLTNAVKYTAKGQIFFNVKCINRNDMSYLIISVQDTGMGIKDEHISKLFTKFERLKVEKNTTVEGTGLGLAITKKLVELMGGKINVKSQYGVGSIFMTQIPQRIAMMSKPLTDTQMLSTLELKKKQDEEVKKINGQRILIVDDNSLNIKVAKIALKNFNLIVDDVSSGEECLKKVRTSPRYDLILMDIMMPEMSGEETFAELKKQMGFNVPVIALTADAVAGAKEKYLNQGFTSYISKPFSPEEIKSELVKIFK